MMAFLTANWGSLLVGLLLLGIVSAIVLKIRRDKKKGKCVGCNTDCGTCPSGHNCNTK